ncbi:MiaB-like tRNA modifying enzyme [Magnetococcus marinus MC-1]|uniref:tRNA (N(6)-L-threonylcarbamoyladenosine(37)-C(2))-methylthiotransferase n=1 Tax=Magnetococcus marinus (strain ATCC BAA-1437 / JCM 17883 / MC-1) TaxID=156889 RepID=A0L6A1_MAGMM|nr:tRNA (N(6)-L-threonylcarbamoyladenosine(37)-C(2))-methylthiotransferase MtaB [Magnetococcus marinus]ABK43494.1 MiaB-like tRNA modifying enzyme [Magnetococcus marinus MC-1]
MDDHDTTKKRIAIINMGCRVNQFEGAAMQAEAAQMGYVSATADETAEVVIVNTCSVTAQSDSQARKQIRRIARENPHAQILVTGCYAQRNPQLLAELPGVALVLGNQEKRGIAKELAILEAKPLAQPATQQVAPMPRTPLRQSGLEPLAEEAPLPRWEEGPLVAADAFKGQARAFVQVQNGCDKRCTFCVIPALRGPSRSQSPQWVMAQAQSFLQAGYQELVLTGIDLGSYGREQTGQGWSLARLVEQLLSLDGLARLRLSSIDPMDMEPALIALMGRAPKLCPHLHLSMQSGDDQVLKRMHRGSTRQALLERVAQLRAVRPELVLGADLIVGFPTESEAAFEQSCDMVRRLEISLLHIFRYSARPDTPAAAIPRRFHVEDTRIKARAKQLAMVGGAVWQQVAQRRVGCHDRVLVEQSDAQGRLLGKNDSFFDVVVENTPATAGTLLPVEIVGWDADARHLLARALS